MKSKILNILALGGFFGPVLFTVVTIVCATFRPEYRHLDQFISELGATGTVNAQLMNYAGFVPSGILIFSFALAMIRNERKPMVWRIGFGFLSLFGFGIFLAGLFSCDQGCPDVGSKESNIHQMIAPITFVSAILGVLLSGISFRKIPYLRSLWKYSIVSGILASLFLLALVNSLETRIFTGLWQRLLLSVLFLWTALIGIRSFRKYDSNLT